MRMASRSSWIVQIKRSTTTPFKMVTASLPNGSNPQERAGGASESQYIIIHVLFNQLALKKKIANAASKQIELKTFLAGILNVDNSLSFYQKYLSILKSTADEKRKQYFKIPHSCIYAVFALFIRFVLNVSRITSV